MMGFFDNIFKRGKAYSDKREPRYACELMVEGGRYLLDEFDMDFDCENSKRYIPMYAVFAEKLSPELETWIVKAGMRKNGTVKFYKNADEPDEGAVFTLEFYKAACIRYRKDTRGDNPATTLVLAAKGIKITDMEY